MKKFLMTWVLLCTTALAMNAEVDPNFYVYICFGQSNMEGNAQWANIDNQYVDPRFQMLATTDFSNPKRKLGEWYTAYCPIVSPVGKLGMADYFGRTMVAALPANVKVGVLAVAMGGSPIEMFDKDKYQAKLKGNENEWWAQLSRNYYGGNPYGRIIEMAKKAQEVGVIKGILLHQGCSNNGDPNWPNMVKKIYNDMLKDLDLKAQDVPLFVGETEREDMGGGCSYHNTVVEKIPDVIPTGHVVSSENIPGNGSDPWHFSASGYRMFGFRYAAEALKVMGLPVQKDPDYEMPDNLNKVLALKSLDIDDIHLELQETIKLEAWGTFWDRHRENLTQSVKFTSSDFKIRGRMIKGLEEKTGTITASYTDFTGQEVTHIINVVVGNGGTDGINTLGVASADAPVFSLQGTRVGTSSQMEILPRGLYIVGGKKVLK